LIWFSSIGAAFSVGCSDTGDSSAVPGEDASTNDSSLDATVASDSRADGHAATDAKEAGPAEKDSALEETGADSTREAGADSTVEDTGPDSVAETGSDSPAETSPDSATEAGHDSSAGTGPDSSEDAPSDSPEDTGVDSPSDTGADSPGDTGSDAAPAPCVGFGNGVEVTGNSGTGACTSGVNTGTLKDSSGNYCCSELVPCTTAGQTGCVECAGNSSDTGNGKALCTPTEAQIVAYDIKTGVDKTAGSPNAASCYACLNEIGCLDDNEGDTGQECEDNAFASGTTVAQCQATLACLLATQCVANGETSCYCGAATPSGTCTSDTTSEADPVPPSTNPEVIGGSCDLEISTGLALPIADGLSVLKDYENTTLASGRVNAIFSCGAACTACE
jgi:hypothetical protein